MTSFLIMLLTSSAGLGLEYGHRVTKRSARTCQHLDTPLFQFLVHYVVVASPLLSKSLCRHMSVKSESPFLHSTSELANLTITLPQHTVNQFCLYRPPSDRKNKFTDAKFLEQFPDLLEFGNFFKGHLLFMGDFNFQFDQPSNTYTSKLLDSIETKLLAFLSPLQQ